MKLKLFALIPIFSLFTLASCKSATDPYKDIEKDSDKLDVKGTFKTEYNENENKLVINDGFIVKFNGKEKQYLNDKEKVEKDYYFITASNTTPTLSRISPKSVIGTSKQRYVTNFYVAYIDNNDKVYVSTPTKVTITNSKVINPVLYYVFGGAILVGCVLIIYFTKRYKETH